MCKSICGILLLAGTWVITAVNVWAQESAAPKPGSFLEVAVTYDALYSNVVTGEQFWMQGGGVQLHGQFWRGLGVVADVAGLHTAKINGSTAGLDTVGLDLVTATFGPRYSWSLRRSRFVFFGQALAGEANGINSTFPGAGAAESTANSLALQLGGGATVQWKHHIAVRAFEADWLRTQLPNSTTNVQNNLRIGAGIVWRVK